MPSGTSAHTDHGSRGLAVLLAACACSSFACARAIGSGCRPAALGPNEAVVTLVWKNPSPHLNLGFSALDYRQFCAWDNDPAGTHRYAVPAGGSGFGLYVYPKRGGWVYFEDAYSCAKGGRLTITIETTWRSSDQPAIKAVYSAGDGCHGQRGMTERGRSSGESKWAEPPPDALCCSEKTPVAGEE
jgi:hypothetical protein